MLLFAFVPPTLPYINQTEQAHGRIRWNKGRL